MLANYFLLNTAQMFLSVFKLSLSSSLLLLLLFFRLSLSYFCVQVALALENYWSSIFFSFICWNILYDIRVIYWLTELLYELFYLHSQCNLKFIILMVYTYIYCYMVYIYYIYSRYVYLYGIWYIMACLLAIIIFMDCIFANSPTS